MKWTKAVHKCPDSDRKVLAWNGHTRQMYLAEYREKGTGHDWFDGHEYINEMTHWAECPPGPK